MAISNSKQVETILVTALANGATVAQAAVQAGVSERTVYRHLQNPAFKVLIQALQDESLRQATAMLSTASAAAVRALIALS